MAVNLDSPALKEAVEQSADPEAVRLGLSRIVDRHPEVASLLVEDDAVRDALVAVTGASRSLTRAVEADPSLLDQVRDSPGLRQERARDAYLKAAETIPSSADPASELRRWKRAQLFRIAARDLLGLADMPAVGRELAALAEVCLEAALAIANPAVPMAVIGMGKLGGAELNYSSDVDVLFVHSEAAKAAGEAERAARTLLSVMAEPSASGIVFRTDANLRPEGRSGPLSRELGAYQAYWTRWAEAWEVQALLKSRAVAGDAELGHAFGEASAVVVWGDALDADAVHAIRSLKARGEEHLRRRGGADREIKRGPGGIRDVEFAVQLLQLVHGRHDADVRSRTTLDALDQLARHGYVEPRDAQGLDAAYRFLRTVEHRLQLLEEQQVHAVPGDEVARSRLARILGLRDVSGSTALDQFDAALRRHQGVARSVHEALFFRPLLEALAGAGPMTLEAAQERLAAFGFRDVDRIRGALRELTEGLSRQSRLMAQMFPLLLEWLSTAPDPDLGLLQLRVLAEGPARSQVLATAFRDSTGAAERTCRLLGSSRVVGQALRRNPDFVTLLGDDDFLRKDKHHAAFEDQARQSLSWRGDLHEHREGIRRFKRRELLRIAARDLLGFADVEAVGRELAALADTAIDASLRALEPKLALAVIGMGRLGGNALAYASDVDVLFVFDGESPADFEEAERTAHALIRGITSVTAEGELFSLDARLRPEGSKGAMARSIEGYRRYYEGRAETWEFLALTKARFVAGDPIVGHQFLSLADPFVYREPIPPEWMRDVRRMKARIESERIPLGEDPQFHLKLGPGTLSDVEFTAQLLQLHYGGAHEIVRGTETVGTIERLVALGVLAHEDGDALIDAYRFCERVRNYRFLHTGRAGDALPSDPSDATHLARLMGYVDRPVQSMRDEYRRLTRRCRRVVERVFYGRSI